MMKLMYLVIVAGLIYESVQQEDTDGDSSTSQADNEDLQDEMATITVPPVAQKVSVTNPPKANVILRPPPRSCNYPRNIKCWTEWFDNDDPCEDGDYELIASLRRKYPGKICSDPADIQVETLSGRSVAQTGDVIRRRDTLVGFICKNSDQRGKKCNDYRVRFSCYSPFCNLKVCWTPFFDRDNPSGSGDWELLSNLRRENPGKICEKPMFIEAVTSDDEIPATNTGEIFSIYNPTQGFVCRRRDQRNRRCRDYKVRFACPCKQEIHMWG